MKVIGTYGEGDFIIYEVAENRFVIVDIERGKYLVQNQWIGVLRFLEPGDCEVSGKAERDDEGISIIERNKEDILKKIKELNDPDGDIIEDQKYLLENAKDYNYRVAW